MRHNVSTIAFATTSLPGAPTLATQGVAIGKLKNLIFGLNSSNAAGTATVTVHLYLPSLEAWVNLDSVSLTNKVPRIVEGLPSEDGARLYFEISAASHNGTIYYVSEF